MLIRLCSSERARALGKLRKQRPKNVKRKNAERLEVKLGCGCIYDVDFSDPVLATALEKYLLAK